MGDASLLGDLGCVCAWKLGAFQAYDEPKAESFEGKRGGGQAMICLMIGHA